MTSITRNKNSFRGYVRNINWRTEAIGHLVIYVLLFRLEEVDRSNNPSGFCYAIQGKLKRAGVISENDRVEVVGKQNRNHVIVASQIRNYETKEVIPCQSGGFGKYYMVWLIPIGLCFLGLLAFGPPGVLGGWVIGAPLAFVAAIGMVIYDSLR
jgi:hypothetical protein